MFPQTLSTVCDLNIHARTSLDSLRILHVQVGHVAVCFQFTLILGFHYTLDGPNYRTYPYTLELASMVHCLPTHLPVHRTLFKILFKVYPKCPGTEQTLVLTLWGSCIHMWGSSTTHTHYVWPKRSNAGCWQCKIIGRRCSLNIFLSYDTNNLFDWPFAYI